MSWALNDSVFCELFELDDTIDTSLLWLSVWSKAEPSCQSAQHKEQRQHSQRNVY